MTQAMMRAIQAQQHGGPEVLQLREAPIPEPGSGQARVRVEAAGVNYIDVYQRTNLYPTQLPLIPGMEAAGIVDEVGPDVTDIQVGDRVAYAMQVGSYAEYAVAPVRHLVKLPDEVDAKTAAAAMLQGMTAHYLVHSTFPLQSGHIALIHAAAGGVGLLLVQMAKRLGATVYGTVSTEEKAKLARDAGADEVILYTQEDFEATVKRLTHDQGVHVVYDSVGKTTFDKGLNCLRPRGYMVLFGQSSGPVPPMNLQILNTKGSLFTTRPSLGHYVLTRDELLWRAGDVLDWIASGELKLRIDRALPLAEAAEAHRLLESRQTAGKLILVP